MRLRFRRNKDTQTGPELTPDVVTKLSARKPEQRVEAERAIERLGPEAVDALMDVLRKESAKRRRKRWALAIVVAYVVTMLTIIILTRKAELIGSVSSMSGVVVSLMAISQAQKNAAKKLAEFDDIRAVGFLVEALYYQDPGVREAAADRLTTLLPRLQASDAGLMTEEQRTALYKAITMPPARRARSGDWAFVRAALRSLEQIGDERALPFVESLAGCTPRNAAQAEIVDAARECKPALLERIAQQRAAMSLLRPAHAPASSGDTLLRATYGPGEADPALLLRPSEPDAGA